MKLFEIPQHNDVGYEVENWDNYINDHKINEWSEKDTRENSE